jgi:hypothetical protein
MKSAVPFLFKVPFRADSFILLRTGLYLTVIIVGVSLTSCTEHQPNSSVTPVTEKPVIENPADKTPPLDTQVVPAFPVDANWLGYHGTHRNAHVAWLPETLEQMQLVWKYPLSSPGLAGVVANGQYVISSDRNVEDTQDQIHAVHADTGLEAWTYVLKSHGGYDYGNSQRATPLIHENMVYCLSASGQLVALNLQTGELKWQKDLVADFQVTQPPVGGYSASPLMVNHQLIISPGAAEASLVALDPQTGNVLWKSPGNPMAYGSLITIQIGQQTQIVGNDESSLGGWDPQTGVRLWTFHPMVDSSFFVPGIQSYGDKLIVTDENNGTLMLGFDQSGKIKPEPLGAMRELSPEYHSPAIWQDRLIGVWGIMFVADLKHELQELAINNDGAFDNFTTIIVGPDRLLMTTSVGDLLLLDPRTVSPRIINRVSISNDETAMFSFPAIVGKRLYVRTTTQLLCLRLGDE